MTERSFKVTVTFESRPDGGLRVWSSDVPGLVLSHADVDGVLADVQAAMEVILSAHLNANVQVEPLEDIRQVLEHNGIVPCHGAVGFVPGNKEYVAYCH